MRKSVLLTASTTLIAPAPAMACDRERPGQPRRFKPLGAMMGNEGGLTPHQEMLLAAIDAEAQRRGEALPTTAVKPLAAGDMPVPSAAVPGRG